MCQRILLEMQASSDNDIKAHWFRRRADLWAIMTIAVLVRLVYAVQFLRSPLAGHTRADQRYYLEWARTIAAGDWLGTGVFEQGPLYPYLLGTFFSLVSTSLVLLLIIQSLFGVLGCWLIFRCAEKLFDRPTAIVAGLLQATYGPGVYYESLVMKSFLSPLLTTVALYGLLRFTNHYRKAWLYVSGTSVGLACLVRENHLLLLIPIAVWLYFQRRESEAAGSAIAPRLLQRIAPILHLSLAATLVLLPSAIRNFAVSGEVVAVTSGGGEVFYIAHGPYASGFYSAPPFVTANPFLEHEDFRQEASRRKDDGLTRSESSRYWFNQGLKSIVANPTRTLRLTIEKALILFNDFEVPDGENYVVARRFIGLLNALPTFGWIGGLALIGTVVTVFRTGRGRIVVGLAAMHAVSVLLLYNFARFRLGMMPMCMLLAAVGVVWLVTTLRQSSLRRRSVAIIAAGVAIIVTVGMFRPPLGGLPPGHRAGSALQTGQFALISGDDDLALKHFQQILEIYRDYDPNKVPKIARLLTKAHLGLATMYQRQQRFGQSAIHLQIAHDLPNRKDARVAVLSTWINVLESAIEMNRNIDVADENAALVAARLELSELRDD